MSVNKNLQASIEKRKNTFVRCPEATCGKIFNEIGLPIHLWGVHKRVIGKEILLNAIKENPGLSHTEYEQILGWKSSGKMSQTIMGLVKTGKVHNVRDGGRKRVFPGPAKEEVLLKAVIEKPKTKKSEKMDKTIRANKPKSETLDILYIDSKRFTLVDGTFFEVVLRKV